MPVLSCGSPLRPHRLALPSRRHWNYDRLSTLTTPYSDSVKLHLLKTQTNKRTETNGQKMNRNLCICCFKRWNPVMIMLMFLIINWPNFVYFIGWPLIFIPPLKFVWSIAVRSHIGWTPTQRTIGQTDVSSSVCVLDGVWHYAASQKQSKGYSVFFR